MNLAYQEERIGEFSRVFVIAGEREELLVDLAAFIDICMQVNFRRLYGGMAKILLHNPEILGPAVQFACIAVTDLVWGDTRRGIIFENMLDSPRRDVLTLLTDKQGTIDPVARKSSDPGECLIIDENNPDLVPFPADTNGMFIEIDIFDIHVTELRYPDASRVDRSYDQFIPRILDRIDQAEYLVMLEVFYLLLFDPGTFNTAERVCHNNSLG